MRTSMASHNEKDLLIFTMCMDTGRSLVCWSDCPRSLTDGLHPTSLMNELGLSSVEGVGPQSFAFSAI